MSRLQDSIIDDDEESCPLCIEEFDLTDKNFKPCPCGYQICQFCFNSLKNTYEKSTCPNCRRVYDEKTIQFKIPTKEDIVHDKENKARKQAATKRKVEEKREVETSNRRNLAGVRVKRQNLVYVIGLVPSVKDESTLLATLRGLAYFGQYGEIDKIVVSKARPGATSQGIGVYITYAAKEAAALCIEVVDGSMNGDRVLRAQYGTTKYCSAYLRGEVCNNKSCTFLHETGEDGHGTTLQNEPSNPRAAARANPTTQPTLNINTLRQAAQATLAHQAASQPMRKERSKEGSKERPSNTDPSALPSTASWGNKDTSSTASKSRRPSHTVSKTVTSPKLVTVALPVQQPEEPQRPESLPQPSHRDSPAPSAASRTQPPSEKQSSRPSSSGRMSPRIQTTQGLILDKLVTHASSPSFRFSFDEKTFEPEDLVAIDRCSSMIDPYGGAKRRLMRQKDAEILKRQAELSAKETEVASPAELPMEDENIESGSLALGGEPEEGARNFSGTSAIQRPSQNPPAGQGFTDRMSRLGLQPRSLTPQQRQQLGFSHATIQAPGLSQAMPRGTASALFDDQRQNAFTNPYEFAHGHGRQSSRYAFANETTKPNAAHRFANHQEANPAARNFYTSSVQGPPPGLKSAGTPPVSGGGMFAQGHGFATNMNAGFGPSPMKETNAEMQMRGRSGTGSGHEVSKRGGLLDLSDPTILQPRHHQNTGGIRQGMIGGQNQDDQDFPPLAPPPRLLEDTSRHGTRVHSLQSSIDSSIRSSTPKVPPGLSLPHAHPTSSLDGDRQITSKKSKAIDTSTVPVVPALPILPIGRPSAVPKQEPVSSVEHSLPDMTASEVKTDENETSILVPLAPTTKIAKTRRLSSEKVTAQPLTPLKRDVAETKNATQSTDSSTAPVDEVVPSKGKKKAKPGVLDISSATDVNEKSIVTPSKQDKQASETHGAALPTSIGSLPGTPSASTAKSTDWLSGGRPRTLRLTTTLTPKSETAPASATTERSSALSNSALRQLSRQASVSSISRSRPSTPTVSDRGTSREISRAGSPPGFDVLGSAVEKGKGKGKARKEKKTKPKVVAETKDGDSAVSAPVVSEEVGPIISRQKKKKRTQDKAGDSHVDGKASEAEKTVDRNGETKKPEIAKEKEVANPDTVREQPTKAAAKAKALVEKPEKPSPVAQSHKKDKQKEKEKAKEPAIPEPPARKSYTFNDLVNDAARLPNNTEITLNDMLNSSISASSLLLKDLLDANELDLQSSLLNAAPLSSYRLPADSRKGAEYLDSNGYTMSSPFGEVYLSGQEQKHLLQGQHVRISDPKKPQNLLKRTMLTPLGAILRHLSQDEEENLIDLETKLRDLEDRHGDAGAAEPRQLDDLDFMNLMGGIQDLMADPVFHRLSLITDEPGTAGDDDDLASNSDEDDDGSLVDPAFIDPGYDDTEDEMAPFRGGFGASPSRSHSHSQPPPRHSGLGSLTAQRRKAILAGTTTSTGGGNGISSVNMRGMGLDRLSKCIRETQVEMEAARREMEGLEKKVARKAKDVARWREALGRDLGRGNQGGRSG